jgi:hypothetical protein
MREQFRKIRAVGKEILSPADAASTGTAAAVLD